MKHRSWEKTDYVGKDLVLKRLQALAYIDSEGNYVQDDGTTTGTATPDQIASLVGGSSAAIVPTSTPNPSNVITAAGGTGSGSFFSGLADIFNATGNAVAKTIAVVDPAKPRTLPGTVGAYVLNPSTGQYVPAVQGTMAMSSQSMLLLAGIGILAVVLLLKH